MSQKSWERRVTALALEAADGLRRIAGRRDVDSVEAKIARAARAAGFSYWRAFDLWYRKARRIDAHELEAIRAAQLAGSKERSDELAAIATDFEALAERVARFTSRTDRESADKFRALAGRARRLASGG